MESNEIINPTTRSIIKMDFQNLSEMVSTLDSLLINSNDKKLFEMNLEKYKNYIEKTLPDLYLDYVTRKKGLVSATDTSNSKKAIDATYTILSEPVFFLCILYEFSELIKCLKDGKPYSPIVADLSFPCILNELSMLLTEKDIISSGNKGLNVSNESAVFLAQVYDSIGNIDLVDMPKYTFLSKIRYLFFPKSLFRYAHNKDLYSGKPISTMIKENGSYEIIDRLSYIIEDRIRDCTRSDKDEIIDAINQGFGKQKEASEEIKEYINQSTISLKGIDARLARLSQNIIRENNNSKDAFLSKLAEKHPTMFKYENGKFYVYDSKFFYHGKEYQEKYADVYATIAELEKNGNECPTYSSLMRVVVNKKGKPYKVSSIRLFRTTLGKSSDNDEL